MALDPNKVIAMVTASAALTTKVAEDERKRVETEKKAAELIPDVVAALVVGDRITEAEREKMAKVLRDPIRTLQFIEKLATHRGAAELSQIGQPDGTTQKAASYNSLESPFVGVPSAQPKQSDQNFLVNLGIAAG